MGNRFIGFLICSASLLFTTMALAEPVDVESTVNGCRVTVTGLEARLVKAESNENKFMAFIDNFSGSTLNSSSGIYAEELLLHFAVPSANNKLSIEKITSKLLGNYNLEGNSKIEKYYNGKSEENFISSNAGIQGNNLNISVNIDKYERQRNIKIACISVQPFEYDISSGVLKIIDTLIFELSFSENCSTGHFTELAPKYRELFATIINKEHLPLLLAKASTGKSNNELKILNTDKWYSSDKKYLKIITHKDGAAYISGSDIISNMPEWNGIMLDSLNLLFRGQPYPIAIINDDNGFLDPGDKIIFYGRRPAGDTTWFDNYTNDAVFYLVKDPSQPPFRLRDFPQVPDNVNSPHKISFSKHFEYDKLYSIGTAEVPTETVECEGWYWYHLYAAVPFHYSCNFSMPLLKSDSAGISMHFYSVNFNRTDESFRHVLKIELNGIVLDTLFAPGGHEIFYNRKIFKDDFFDGINTIEVTSLGSKDLYGNTMSPDDVGIDYFEITGEGEISAEYGQYSSEILCDLSDSKLEIAGMAAPKAFIIDTSKNLFSIESNAESGTTVKISSKSGNWNTTLISFNDSVLANSVKSGVYICTSSPPDFNVLDSKYFSDAGTDAANYIRSLPGSTIIALAVNPPNNISGEFRNELLNIGSANSGNIQPTSTYILAGIKNSGMTERITDNSTGISLLEFVRHLGGKSFEFKKPLKKDNTPYKLSATAETNVEKAIVEKVNSTNLRSEENYADMLIISHKNFLESAGEYADYRRTTDGLSIKIIDVEDIYKEFYYGRKSPHAIKEFLRYSVESWLDKPVYVLFYGDASWDARKILDVTIYNDYVPSYGRPISDFWYCQLDGDDFMSELIHGRIPLRTNEQGKNYLDKIREYDSIPNYPWMKKFLLISGGLDANEQSRLYGIIQYFAEIITQTTICGDTALISKTQPTVGEIEADVIKNEINSGIFWTMFLGHGSPSLLDIDGWQADRLNNKSRYGILTTFSCNTGAFAEPDVDCRNESYLLTPEKGFVVDGGATGVGFIEGHSELAIKLLRILRDTTLHIQSYARMFDKVRSINNNTDVEKLVSQQYAFLGDPLLKYRMSGKPDFYMLSNETTFANTPDNILKNAVLTETDSMLYVTGTVYNVSLKYSENITLLLIREYQAKADSLYYYFQGICNKDYFLFELPIKNMPGTHKITIIIDPEKNTGDINEANNIYIYQIDVFKLGLLPLDPLPYWNVSSENPNFRVINPFGYNDIVSYEFSIFDAVADNKVPLAVSDDGDIIIHENYIEWKPPLRLENKRQYIFTSRYFGENMLASSILEIPFLATDKSKDIIEAKLSEIFLNNCLLKDMYVNDSDTNYINISLVKDSLKYNLVSVCGNASIVRGAEVDFADTTYYTNPPVYVGFLLVVLSGDDYHFKDKRHFDTWGALDSWSDSTSIRLVRYLRDTVTPGDYLLLATSGEASRLLRDHGLLHDEGSLDTLITVLKQYGSKLIEDYNWGSSFAMLGRRSSEPGNIPECINTENDTAKITGYLYRKHKSGSISTPVFGPAKRWDNFTFDGMIPENSTGISIEVYGYNRESSGITFLFESLSGDTVNLSQIDPLVNPYLSFTLNLRNGDDDIDPNIGNLNCSFIPAPEFALVKSKTFLSPESVMRGETSQIKAVVENISSRSSTLPSNIHTKISSNSGIYDDKLTGIDILLPDTEQSITIDEITDNFDTGNLVRIEANSDYSNNELYYFNNSADASLSVYEDDEKPYVLLYADGRLIRNGDYIPIRCPVTAELYDNSKLAQVNPAKLKIRLNSIILDANNSTDYEFVSSGRNIPLKSTLSLVIDTLVTSYKLEYGENIFTVYAWDATGNPADTLIVQVNVSRNAYIEDIKVYPLPTGDNSTIISFNYKAPDPDGSAVVYLYDITGRLIREMRQELHIGENKFEWDFRDNTGNSVSDGIYLIFVKSVSNYWAEPCYSKLFLAR